MGPRARKMQNVHFAVMCFVYGALGAIVAGTLLLIETIYLGSYKVQTWTIYAFAFRGGFFHSIS